MPIRRSRHAVTNLRDMPRPHSPEHSLLLHDDRLSAERRLAARIADALHRGDKVIHSHLGRATRPSPACSVCCRAGSPATSSSSWSRSPTSGRIRGQRRRGVVDVRREILRARDEGFPGVTCTADDGGLAGAGRRRAGLRARAARARRPGRHHHRLQLRPRRPAGPGPRAGRGARRGALSGRRRRLVGHRARHMRLPRRPARRHERRPGPRRAGAGGRRVGAHRRPARRHLPLPRGGAGARGGGRPGRRTDEELRLVRIPPIVRRTFEQAGLAERPGVAMPPPTPSPRSRAPARSRCASPTCSRA